MAYQRRKYKLVNLDNGREIELNSKGTNNEPKNWDNADFTIKRSTKNFSITTELSKNLEFTGAGARFLIDAYNSKGIEANVQMYEYRFNPNTDVPYIFTIGWFDFSEYSRTKTTVKIPFLTGGLNSIIKTKGKDKFELNRTESINGADIGELTTKPVAIINRPIFLDTLLETDEKDRNSQIPRMSFGTAYRYGFYSIPHDLQYDSDDRAVGVPANQFQNIGARFNTPFDGNLNFDPLQDNRSQLFYYNNDVQKNIDITINLSMDGINYDNTNLEDHYGALALVKFQGGENPVFQMPDSPLNDYTNDNFIILQDITSLVQGNNINISYSGTLNIDLLEGESLGLFTMCGGEFDVFAGSAQLDLEFENINSSIRIEELSIRNDLPRQTKFVLNKDVGERFGAILTDDKTAYKSEFFESSEFKFTGITNGKLIRGFEDLNITTSFKDWVENCNSLFNMGYNIEIINGKETIVHEPLKHFFRNEVVITLPEQVSNVKRSVAKEFIYSTIKSGYKKPSGDNLYEEVNGLNEFNTSNEYITPITRIDSEYDIESPYRADTEGKELTVRKHRLLFPTEDYRTDKTIFNLDCKETPTGVFEERTWVDDYESAPLNVFSPDSVTGLRLTPFRNMERHFWFIKGALTRLTDKFIRYSSTRGNSELQTKKSGDEYKKENGNFLINSLENSIFVSEWIEFEYKVNFDILTKIKGFTEVNGRKIPNTYFKIGFINEYGEVEYGYLFELKPAKSGKWKLLKAV